MASIGYEQPAITPVSAEDYSEASLDSLSVTTATSKAYGVSKPDYSQFELMLRQQYGFETAVTRAIAKFWHVLSQTVSEEYRASYLFYRVLGALVYGSSSLVDSLKWSAVAGEVIGVTDSIENLSGYLMEKICLAKEEVYELVSEVKEQHKVSFNPSSSSEDNRMYAKPDFAHFCISTATCFASKLGYGAAGNVAVSSLFDYAARVYGVSRTREYLAGWLGDLILGDHTMGRDDYAADADALHIASTIDSLLPCRQEQAILIGYFGTQSKVPKKRAVEYKSFIDIDQAAQVVGFYLVDENGSFDADTLISALETRDQYSDVLRFFKVAKGRTAEPSCTLYLD